jgi:hypothetical protein
MCKIWDFDSSRLVRDGCTKCMIDCYRDASVLQGAAVAVSDSWHGLGRGRVASSAKHLFNKSMLGSLRAIVEHGAWTRRLRLPRDSEKCVSSGVTAAETR